MSPIIVELESINAELNTAGKALKTSKKEIKENFPSMDQMEVKLKDPNESWLLMFIQRSPIKCILHITENK